MVYRQSNLAPFVFLAVSRDILQQHHGPLAIYFQIIGFRQKWAFRLLAFTCLCEAYNHWALEHRGQQAITAAVEISYYVKLVTALAGEPAPFTEFKDS